VASVFRQPLAQGSTPGAQTDDPLTCITTTTELCRSFRNTGRCKKGHRCKLLHIPGPPITPPQRGRCWAFERSGSCKKGDGCSFLHGVDDDGSRLEKKATQYNHDEETIKKMRENLLAKAARDCELVASSETMAIIHKPAGVGTELSDALPLILGRSNTKNTSPSILLPVVKAAHGLVLVNLHKERFQEVVHQSVATTFVVVSVCDDVQAEEKGPPGSFSIYNCEVLDVHASNTDGLLFTLLLTSSRSLLDLSTNNPSPVKELMRALSDVGFPALGSSGVCAKRRCSGGRGLFVSVTGIECEDGLRAKVKPPIKFKTMVEREKKFAKPSEGESVTGIKTFYGIDFRVTKDVMDPCTSSAVLVSTATALLSQMKNPVILDAGTGSGNLILSLLSALPSATGIGVDISKAALQVAKQNAIQLKLESRLKLLEGKFDSLRDATKEWVDCVICNPPYHLSRRKDSGPSQRSRVNDPALALFGTGEDGLGCYRELGKGLPGVVKSGGFVVVEVPSKAAARVFDEAMRSNFEDGRGDVWKEGHEEILSQGYLRGVVYQMRGTEMG
jgi:HemK-like putative methylase